MNGVTGRMGTNQHLVRSILAIQEQGGVKLNDDEVIIPQVILVGRNENKLQKLASKYGVEKYSTDLDQCLSDAAYRIYFDAQRTDLRVASLKKAIAAGKHIYCEKPTATNLEEAMELYRTAKTKGIKHGVVQDKLWLPGIQKLNYLVNTGYFGRILAVRGEFGYWVFDGKHQPTQRPSWNSKVEEGGGIILDMIAHWRYVLDNLFGNVAGLSCIGTTLMDSRIDENGNEYPCTADDTAFATIQLENKMMCHFNFSWVTRVRRDDLLVLHVDGTKGSAVAGLRECYVQPDASTPCPVWNPDIPSPLNYYEHWQKMPTNVVYDNAFKAQWELYLKHIVLDTPFPWDLLEGAKGVQMAQKAMESWKERKWVDLESLED